jgi:predicted component of type VI protein secretion system
VNSLKTASVVALASSLLLAGCGGGGSSADNNVVTPTSTITTSSVVGVDFSHPSASSINTTSVVNQSPMFSNVSSLHAYTLNDGSGSPNGQYTFNTASSKSDNFIAVSSQGHAYLLGGTTWSYARFGLFLDFMTAEVMRATPFFLASIYGNPTLTDATYATNGLAVGLFSNANQATFVKCNASAEYMLASKKIVLTLSACFDANADPAVAAAVASTGSIELSPNGYVTNSFSINPDATTTAENLSHVVSSDFKLAGSAGQELVGAITVKGGSSYFTFAFGAQK